MTVIRFYYVELGGHTHIAVFSGNEINRGKAGDLVMTNEEFAAFKDGTAIVEFLPEKARQA